ncbi:MAG: transcription termination factor NusA [Verrucomicrobiales bacterium]|jgi:N utilization substance protein A|nr:transcription termination factor NusA [Verrucomicrobiales bacterium]
MSQEFLAVLEYMEKEKGIDRRIMIKAIEQALISAAKRSFGLSRDIRVLMDSKSGRIQAYASMKAVEKVTHPYEEIVLIKARAKNPLANLGDLVEVEIPPAELGRIAAQVFRQTLNQNVRSIEKTMIVDEFKDRIGDIITGTVRRFERSDVIVDLGKFEAIMPAKERVPTEEYSPGERIRALILAVDHVLRGPQIVLSRSHPNFVRRLFELEVNELHDGTVEIKGLAREAGYRTKIAVWSKDEKVDPVGACVGLRGARVKNIVRELNNEKIDLFRWSDSIRDLIIEALKPAKLKHLEIDQANKHAKALVDEENLSIAIGRRGQNARLTAKLTGWEIDIGKEENQVQTFENKFAEAAQKLARQLEIDNEAATQLVKAGFPNIEVLEQAEPADIQEAIPELSADLIQSILTKVNASKGGATA